MSEVKIYKVEKIREGKKTTWPLQSVYVAPSKKGFIFDGWDFNWQNDVIVENTKIHPIWDRVYVGVNINNVDIDSNGGEVVIKYWLYSNLGKRLNNNMEIVRLSSEQHPTISREMSIENVRNSVENGVNVMRFNVPQNTIGESCVYLFKVICKNYGGLNSNTYEIIQRV